MRPQEVKNTIIAGIFVVILFSITAIFVSMLSKERSLLDKKAYLYIKMDNAMGLRTGSAVKFKGIKIGSIEEISIKKIDAITISLQIVADYLEWIKKDSYATVNTQGVLGDKYVEILGGSIHGRSLSSGDFISLKEEKGLDDFITDGEDILSSSKIVLNSANKAMLEIESLVAQLNDGQRVKKSLANISATTKELTGVSKQIGILVRQINEGPGTLHSLIYNPALYNDAQTLLGGAQRNKVLKYFVRESIKKAEEVEQED